MHKELKINTNVPANHSNSSNRAFIKPSYVCTECGSPMKHIYTHQYSNVYLSDCKKCGNVADKYVEYEMVIIVLDLLLHRPQAFRHLLFNRFRNFYESFSNLIRLSLFGILLFTYVKFGVFENESKRKYNFVRDADIFFMILVKSTLENLSYCLGVLISGYLCMLLFCRNDRKNVTNISHLILATLLSNFVLVGYVPMIIWKEHYSSTFVLAITLFHISASLIAFYVLQLHGDCTHKVANMLLAIAVLIVGHSFRFVFQYHFLDRNDPVTYQSLLKRLVGVLLTHHNVNIGPMMMQ